MDCREARRRRDPDAVRPLTSRPTSNGPTTCSAAPTGGAELAVLPEMFNTGYGLCPDFGPYAETRDGPTLRHLRRRSRQWGMAIAAGFVERDGHHLYDSLALRHARRRSPRLPQAPPGLLGTVRGSSPAARPLVVSTPWGRVGFAICADMIYRKVWRGYRDRIDVAVSAAAWPDFADRGPGRKHWLLGHVGPLSASIPGRVAQDLGIPVIFANQCGETRHRHPVPGQDRRPFRRPEQHLRRSPRPAGARRGRRRVVLSSVTVHPQRGLKSWHTMSPSAPAASSSGSVRG